MSIKGYPTEGRRSDIESDADALGFATVVPRGVNRRALDIINSGAYTVAGDIVESGSTSKVINATAHLAKRGDIIRFTSSAVEELECIVKSTTTDTITIFGATSVAPSAADTFDILRPITERFSSTGTTLATLAGAIQFKLDGTDVDVLEDTVTPANNQPLPVKLVDAGGDLAINIANQNLEVQLSAASATPDSVRIGDGTETVEVNASGEMQVRDDDANTAIGTANTNLGTLISSNAAIQTAVELLDNAVNGTTLNVTIADEGAVATQATLAALNAKFSALGIKANAASAPVVLSSEQNTLLTNMVTSLQLLDNAVNGNTFDITVADAGTIATEATLAALAAVDFATETTLAAQSAKFPASLGQKNSSASFAVTMASDQSPLPVNKGTPVDFLDLGLVDSSTTNIPVAGVQVVASLAAACNEIEIQDDIGEYMVLTDGSDVILSYLPLGGGSVKVSIAAGTALKLASRTGATIIVGKIAMNFLN